MKLNKPAKAGTYESNDIMIMLFPNPSLEIELESNVLETFGDQIKALILTTLKEVGLEAVKVKAVDKGALDFTIRARLLTAIKRGVDRD
jgi:citrate lyase subunit gamma (acyl carrier protein)